MTDSIYKVLQSIAADLLALSALVLETDAVSNNVKVNENTLADSALKHDLATEILADIDGNPVISALFNHYVVYLEWTRPPKYGKPPPISALKDWAAKRGLPTDSETLYAISHAIWRDGHEGRPIFATIDKEIGKLYADDWADKLYEAILNDLKF